jgi:hypothetical protein
LGATYLNKHCGDVHEKTLSCHLRPCASPYVSACNEKGQPVAVVNAAQVYTECESGKQAREYLEKITTDMQNDLLELQAAAANAPAATRQSAIEKLQTTSLEYQQRIRLEEQQILNKISEDYQSSVDAYRKAIILM